MDCVKLVSAHLLTLQNSHREQNTLLLVALILSSLFLLTSSWLLKSYCFELAEEDAGKIYRGLRTISDNSMGFSLA